MLAESDSFLTDVDVIAMLSPTTISSALITTTDVSPDALPRKMTILGWRRDALSSRCIVTESQTETWLTPTDCESEWIADDFTVRWPHDSIALTITESAKRQRDFIRII